MAYNRLISKPAARVAALSIALFAVNVYVCRELFTIEYLRHMGSIEAAFISLARYVRDNWTDLSWFPLWYGGIPYQDSYPPVMHVLVAAVAGVTHWSPALAYHATAAFVYCAGPVSLFWLCRRLSRRLGASFFAGLFYSLVSPSALLIDNVRRDLGGMMRPRRLQTLIVYGEDPHVMGLTLLGVSILLLDYACEKRRPWAYVLAAVSFAATALTNWLAGAALAIGVVALLLASEFPQLPRRVLGAVLIGAIAYALAAPLVPPSTIRTIQFNSRTIEGDFTHYTDGLILRLAVLAVTIAAAKWGLTRIRASRAVQFGAYFTLITAAITLSWAYAKIVFVPQPHRYHTEMEWGIAILIAFSADAITARMPKRATAVLACIALILAVPFARSSRRYAHGLLEEIDITQRVEFRLARWLKANMPEARVMVPGSMSWFLNAFTDNPQLGGGFDQGTTNFQIRVATYLMYWTSGDTNLDAEASIAWLKTFGVQAIAIGGPRSGEFYKPYQNPSKFVGKLDELWREGDDVLYRVPQRTGSLAHVITRNQLPPRTPYNGVDLDALRPYLRALDDPQLPPAPMRWTSRHSAVIDASLTPDQIVSVQITHHPGWHAAVNGRDVPVSADHVGQTVIEPRCSGPCSIELRYDGGAEMLAARMLRWIAILACLFWIATALYFDVRKRVAPPRQ